MRALHGRSWPQRAGAAVGRRPLHLVSSAAGGICLAALAARRPRVATVAGLVWAGITADFARARVVPGPWQRGELARMLATSVVIPPVATYHWLRGLARHRGAEPWAGRPPERVDAVLVDRDGTIVRDVPYNGDPDRVEAMPGAREALDRLRAAGVPIAVVTNQSGVARGLLSEEQVQAVNARVEAELGPFADWQVCPHADADGCGCRKPAPGMVRAAAAALGGPVRHCLLVGDTGADVEAALGAGAQAVLVPDPVTRSEEIKAAPWVAVDLDEVVNTVLARRGGKPLTDKEKVSA
jgi:histidinol-phosphate phosphatase family protein